MKQVITLLSVCLVTLTSSIINAQTVSIQLDLLCTNDPELGGQILEVVQGNTESNFFSNEEMSQINGILADEQNQGLDVSGRYHAVVQACSENRIFQERHSYVTDAEPVIQ